MVLVRLSYVVDLPPPSDVARQPAPTARDTKPPKPGDKSSAGTEVTANAPVDAPTVAKSENPAPSDVEEAPQTKPLPEAPMPQSLADVVDLAEAQRDLKLKNALLEQVRLVHFKPGDISLNPLPLAAPDLLQELMRKLKAWTGRVWIVSTSEQEGEEPLGAQRRAAAAQEVEALQSHPAVQEVLRHFPGAKIKTVREASQELEDAKEAPDDDTDDDVIASGETN
jgi:DNA polymerase-3 subunit gamma/tau